MMMVKSLDYQLVIYLYLLYLLLHIYTASQTPIFALDRSVILFRQPEEKTVV